MPVLSELAEAVYHASPEISRSELALFRQSRREYRATKLGLLPGIGEETFCDNLDVGTAVHLLLLEPEKFLERVSVWDGKTRSGNEWKRFKARADSERKIVLKESDWWLVAVAAAVIHQMVGGMLDSEQGHRELSLFWKQQVERDNGEVLSFDLRCRLDLLFFDDLQNAWIFDIKTCADASVSRFRKDIIDRAYWLQDAHYTAGVMQAYGLQMSQVNFVFLAVGKAICSKIARKVADSSCVWGIDQIMKCRQLVAQIGPIACSSVTLLEEERRQALRAWEQTLLEFTDAHRNDDWEDPGENEIQTVSGVVREQR